MGVQVPPEWNPADQSTFMEAVATASRRTADASYNDFVMKHFQQALPPGLDWEGFCSQPTIQAALESADRHARRDQPDAEHGVPRLSSDRL